LPMPTEREHLYTDGSWTPDRVWDPIGIGAVEFPDRELSPSRISESPTASSMRG